jgi:hypothetical protein
MGHRHIHRGSPKEAESYFSGLYNRFYNANLFAPKVMRKKLEVLLDSGRELVVTIMAESSDEDEFHELRGKFGTDMDALMSQAWLELGLHEE